MKMYMAFGTCNLYRSRSVKTAAIQMGFKSDLVGVDTRTTRYQQITLFCEKKGKGNHQVST